MVLNEGDQVGLDVQIYLDSGSWLDYRATRTPHNKILRHARGHDLRMTQQFLGTGINSERAIVDRGASHRKTTR
jgi:hypothetical protein